MFDIATPNPTGSLSGPWFDVSGSGNVTGVRGRNSHLACRVKNLANQTVSQQKIVAPGSPMVVTVYSPTTAQYLSTLSKK